MSEEVDGEYFDVARFEQEDFEIVIRRTRKFLDGKHYVHYRLFDNGWKNDPCKNECEVPGLDYAWRTTPIFEGDDLGCSPLHDPISLHTVASLLSFLSCGKFDVDPEYFDGYTERQLQWRDERAETLSIISCHINDMIEKHSR